MYDEGAEARIDPGPPRFLGEEARKTAAVAEEARLRREAVEHRREAGIAEKEAADRRSVVSACRAAGEALDAATPELLLARKDHADAAAKSVAAVEASLTSAMVAVEAAEARVGLCRDRQADLSAAVAAQGLAELRQRAEELEKELEFGPLGEGGGAQRS